jgi:hypothetical protein
VKPLEDLPNTFWCLMTKGEKYQLKFEGLALLCYVLLCLEKLDCLALPNRFLSIFSLPCNSGLEDMLYCVNFGVNACNMFVNLNYACSCVLVISYRFMSYLCKYVCVNALKSLVYVFLSICRVWKNWMFQF